ncbi:hypothetical protein BD779DRAFT_1468537 [Infundibulicybe gibba]|nr:hypothetical protein BD779DRAFT_1468537 [Infundibulicybe gibba]
MGKLTEIALKSMEDDTQLVSILYRTHKTLPSASKVSSLYVFDALSRAARHQVNKQGITGDINSERGNCATFLLKVEGILEGLFQDMVTVGSSESKEKTKKILDIWVKGNTFPAPVLSQLTVVVSEPEVKPVTPPDPRAITQTVIPKATPPASAQSPVLPGLDPQSALLALLAQAANAVVAPNPGQTPANTASSLSQQLDPTQIAVLQQLAQTASNPSLPRPTSHPAPHAPPHSGSPNQHSRPRSPLPYRDEPVNPLRRESRFERYHSPERTVKGYDDHIDDRGSSRGTPRGGFRGRGRGDTRPGSRWDDRDRDRYKPRDQSTDWNARRKRSSRSRSPNSSSRYNGGRDVKPFSPSRRPPVQAVVQREEHPNGRRPDVGKDEFGRDLRPASPEPPGVPSGPKKPQSPLPLSPTVQQSNVEPAPNPPTNINQTPVSPLVDVNTSTSAPNPTLKSNTNPTPLGMENFDLATFDFTAPSSWEGLGKMWQITHGYMPTTEQLMQFVMTGGPSPGPVSAPIQTHIEPEITNDWRSGYGGQNWRGRGRGEGRGRGGFGHGKGRNGQGWNYEDQNQTTDAIVLGGGSDDPPEDDVQMFAVDTNQAGSSGGRMERIDDKWVFVRDATAGVS